MAFEFDNVISPEDDNYQDVVDSIGEGAVRFPYNDFIESYNKLKVGQIPHFEFESKNLSNFKKQLEKRGLIPNVDFKADVNPIEEKTEDNPNPVTHIFVQRLTAKMGEKYTPKPAGRKPAAAAGDAKDDGKGDNGKGDGKGDAKADAKGGAKAGSGKRK